ncbi:MAG: PilZ domain-containing protein [Vicinamibacteria bacterium]|nr:PilZ domain-containing protein [Vicinamibacteria bacterium]
MPRNALEDARRDERFEIPTDVVLRKLGSSGAPEKEERTIAHDLSRSGMRILTSWPDLEAGDQVAVQEVGGNFSSAAVVRHVKRGTDRITRVGVEFLENQAPDRLVGTTTGLARPVFDSVSSSVSAGSGSGPISPLGESRPIPRRRNSGSISRPRTATSIPRPPVPPPSTTSIPRPSGSPPSAPAPAARTTESLLEEIAVVRATARGLIAASKIWEALECLAKAQLLAEGTSEERAIKILTWETQAKVPSLMRAAEQSLEELARNEPGDAAVHSALGRIFWEARLSARARVAFNRVLALDPSNREATAALAVLNDPKKRR